METKWLNDFVELSVSGNFRLAAQQRGVSQPAFSRRIQALESWIGASLIDRSIHPSQLTEAGKLFLPVAQEIIDIVTSVKSDVHAQVQQDKEKLRFSTLSSLAQIFIPGWLKSLRPLIEVTQFVVKTEYDSIDDYFSALQDNSVDFHICFESPDFRFHDDELIFTSLKLGRESIIPVTSPNDKGASRWWLPDRPKSAIPCLHTFPDRSPSPIQNHMRTKYGDLNFKSVYDSSISQTLKAMAIEGFGLAWIPSAHIVDELANGLLVRAAERKDDIEVDINIYRCLRHNEPRVDKFWKVLQRQQMLSSKTRSRAAD